MDKLACLNLYVMLCFNVMSLYKVPEGKKVVKVGQLESDLKWWKHYCTDFY